MEIVYEISATREVIGLLREYDIETFDSDTKINTYSNKSFK